MLKLLRRVNWLPLFWVVFLIYPVRDFLAVPRPAGEGAVFGAALIVLLYLYAKNFMILDSLPPGRAWNRAAVAATFGMYGLAEGLRLDSAATFLIYAAALAGFQPDLRLTLGVLGALLGLLGLQVGLGQMDITALLYVSFMAVAVGVGNAYSYRWMERGIRMQQLQAEKERLVRDAERERIGRDLHDLLGHTLSVIVLKSQLASRLTELDPARAVREIHEVERISREALQEVRAAVRGYRGSGLNAELGRCKVALDAAGITLEYEGEPLDLTAPVEQVLELALREAVTNVVRHSGARRVRVRIGAAGPHVELEVHDDGRGGLAPEGAGLTGMRERVRALGGELVRDGRAGTRLLVRLPRTDASAPSRPRQVLA
ncbi:two-component system sensor histidine kinase DesK [Deinobacterium chartae]|uniref:Two-component system sensor histidine kinase DesK n=1 Tax=Deinobacterium chartae TaxID=521158 RepID=A0A841I808_9DEIO|nr:sensor histidine kinase [Deinobacterium chartae]MBB6099972.1 two-component system sensor histidine kinase DesK [Deinobacterium chartae]